ncbi:hypothetical protein HO133_003033 [Letharia lupina]|uniref:TOG domain-containing protein n=1 Tax=Letharia lupina TaxID=560253 RepID=A0A8H6CBY3_9LECA|nr:uncharacterized protein HO133_003033 [Letharia lupina]KAF6220600.1 hypothetical protein HO133_003033 [Letharia lupina]
MELLASNTLTALKSTAPIDTKLKHLTELKAEIKHRHCPEHAVAPLFDAIRISLATPHLTDAGFSILGHLMKRLELQDQDSLLQAQGIRTYPCLLERLADQKDRIRQRALQAFTDFHSVSPPDVEQYVRDHALTNRHPKTKEAGMQWVISIRSEKNIPFRTFVPNIVDCLEEADGSVRRTAQSTIIELFQNAGIKGTNDLQKHLQQRNVRRSIVDHILSELGLTAHEEIESAPPTQARIGELPRQTHFLGSSTASDPPLDAPPMSVSEQEAVHLDPLYIESHRDLEETFREMHPYFEGKESEQNWLKREKSILKLRKITKGNALQDFTTVYLAGIKGLLDGILKTVNSLRTTVSAIGCHLVQDLARVAGPGLDSMVEILLQNLIKLCANTKKITAAKGNDTVSAIMANVTFNSRLTQHIYSACQDKNVQPRSYACGWLKIIINKHGHHKHVIEHAGGLEWIEKCLRAGLGDRDLKVRESMRSTYWAFARLWPERSEVIMSTLDKKQQDLLIEDPSNPNPHKIPAPHTTVAGAKPGFSHSTTSVPARPSIKETIAAQKKAKLAGKHLPERPGSAEPFGSPKKSVLQPSLARPATAMSAATRNVSTTSIGTLSSAPVRPRRRADVARPATADPYSTRKPARTETPPRSPAVSPVKRPKTPANTASTIKMGPTKIGSPASTSSVKANSSKKAGIVILKVQPQHSPTKAAEDFTMVMPNMSETKSNASDFLPSLKAPIEIKSTSSLDIPPTGDPFMPTESENAGSSPSPRKYLNQNGSASSINGHGGDKSHTSPTKLANDFDHLSMNGASSQRISMSPRAIGSRKENLTMKTSYFQEQRPLQVYEDPVLDPSDGKLSLPPLVHTPGALEELPVNEPAKQHRQVFDHQLLAEEPASPEYHQKWLAIEAAERQRISNSENIDNPRLARKILDSGIVRVQSRSLDVHGFRKLQALIRTSGESIWEGGYKFDELILPLLEYLETPNDESTPRTGKAQDLKTQVLVTVRVLLQHQPKYFFTYHPRALTAVLAARKHYSSTSHIVCGLEETAESIVHQCDPSPCIDSVMDLLETERPEGAETNTILMGLYVLAGLLHRGQEKGTRLHLSEEQEERLGWMGARCLSDTNPDIRRAVIEFVLELYDTVDQKRFWGLVTGAKEDHRSLITYYLARKRAVMQ